MPADEVQLHNLKDVLQKFTRSTGLRINYHKSSMVPINISQERCQELASAFGCKVEALPFTYLGLPLGSTKPKVDDLMPMICRVDKKLAGIANMLAYSSRLVTIKAVITAIPNHAMCAMKVPFTCLDHVDGAARNFLWYGKDINKSGKCLVKWDNVCLSKKSGGLGLIKLRDQNKALMMKNLYKFYNRADIPWVNLVWRAHYGNGELPDENHLKGSFWWKDCLSYNKEFKEIFKCKPVAGDSILFWHDIWYNDTALKNSFPQLFSFAKSKRITLYNVIHQSQSDIYEIFNLPLSIIAVEQCNRLIEIIQTISQDDNEVASDLWSFPGHIGKYPTRKVYLKLTETDPAPPPYKWIWKSCCLPKQKFFFWVLLQDRLNTRNLLARKNFHIDSKSCILCDDQVEETMMHLFFECDFSQTFWWKIGEEWNLDFDLINMIIDAKNRSSNLFFKEALMCGCWSIWNERNGIIFDGKHRDLNHCYSFFKSSVGMIRHRVKPSLKEGMQNWLDTL
jgi:hypothetical protein